MARANRLRLLDTMIFVYFHRAGLLEAMLQLPEIGITTSVRRELRRWPKASEQVENALLNGRLALCDMDPSDETERSLYVLYRDRDGLGDGEAASMAVARTRGYALVSHDMKARSGAVAAGTKVLDWPDLLTELYSGRLIDDGQRNTAERAISGLMRGR